MEKNVDIKYYDIGNLVNHIHVHDGFITVKQATKTGYVCVYPNSIFDLSYPTSKTRRGRLQKGGQLCPTLTATQGEILYFEPFKEEDEC